MGPLAIGVAFFGLEWPSVTTVVMAILNIREITDWRTEQTEGQMKYSQAQVRVCVNVCQFNPL
jgi:hypothetical protein